MFENYTACLETEEQRVELSLWDTSGKAAGPQAPSPRHWAVAAAATLFASLMGRRSVVLARKLKEGDLKIPLLGVGGGAGPGVQNGRTPEATPFSGSSFILRRAGW